MERENEGESFTCLISACHAVGNTRAVPVKKLAVAIPLIPYWYTFDNYINCLSLGSKAYFAPLQTYAPSPHHGLFLWNKWPQHSIPLMAAIKRKIISFHYSLPSMMWCEDSVKSTICLITAVLFHYWNKRLLWITKAAKRNLLFSFKKQLVCKCEADTKGGLYMCLIWSCHIFTKLRSNLNQHWTRSPSSMVNVELYCS